MERHNGIEPDQEGAFVLYADAQRALDAAQDDTTKWFSAARLQREENVTIKDQLEAVRRERDAPIYVCQRCGRLGRDGWIATYYESVFDGPLRGMKCPTCDCPDLEKNTAKELAALCTRLQAALDAERERVTGLEGELMHRDKQLQHVCVTLEAVSTQLDAERIRREQVEMANYAKDGQIETLQAQLTQLQGKAALTPAAGKVDHGV